jgi:thioredoxin-related protein
MKTVTTILLSWIAFGALSQERIEMKSISQLTADTSHYKIIFISADWCRICPNAQKAVESSEKLAIALDGAMLFYKIENTYELPIEYMDSTFYYVQTGINEGYHQLIDHLMNSTKVQYPTFIMLDKNDKVMDTFPRMLSEQDWLEVAEIFHTRIKG